MSGDFNAKEWALSALVCPACTTRTLWKHASWSTGDLSDAPYYFCDFCGLGWHLFSENGRDDYYSPKNIGDFNRADLLQQQRIKVTVTL